MSTSQAGSSAQPEESNLPEEAATRSRRSLKKCSQCRTNRKKCLPVNREWPQKCERCTKSGYQCSRPLLKREDGIQGQGLSGIRADNPIDEDDEDDDAPGEGLLVSVENKAEPETEGPRPKRRGKRRRDDFEATNSPTHTNVRKPAKKKRLEQDQPDKGMSVEQMLLKIRYLHLAAKEIKRKKAEHICYYGSCDICSLFESLKENLDDELKPLIAYAESIAETNMTQCQQHQAPNQRTALLDNANNIYNLLMKIAATASDNGFTIGEPYNKIRIKKHVDVLKLRKDWPEAEYLLGKLLKPKDPTRDRPELGYFQEYLDCLEATSTVMTKLVGAALPPNFEMTIMNLDLPIPSLHRAIASDVQPPDSFQADVDERDMFGRQPLLVAAFYGKVNWCKHLIANCGADVNVTDLSGHTALEIASFKAHPRTVQFLLENKAEVNPKLLGGSVTPLHAAIHGGSLDVVKRLVEYGASLDAQTSIDETTPINLAREQGSFEIRNYILRKAEEIQDMPAMLGADETLLEHAYHEGTMLTLDDFF